MIYNLRLLYKKRWKIVVLRTPHFFPNFSSFFPIFCKFTPNFSNFNPNIPSLSKVKQYTIDYCNGKLGMFWLKLEKIGGNLQKIGKKLWKFAKKCDLLMTTIFHRFLSNMMHRLKKMRRKYESLKKIVKDFVVKENFQGRGLFQWPIKISWKFQGSTTWKLFG